MMILKVNKLFSFFSSALFLKNLWISFIGFTLGFFLLPEAVSAVELLLPHRLPRTGQISTFNTLGAKIDFLGSRQDGELQRGAQWPDPRFIVNEEGTVSDRLTGLMWLRDGECFGAISWPSSHVTVKNINKGQVACQDYTGSYTDWFVPQVGQLASLINAEELSNSNFLQLGGISDVQADKYWSATEHRNIQNAWVVDLANGDIVIRNKLAKTFLLPARVYDQALFEKFANLNSVGKAGEIAIENAAAPLTARFSDNSDGTITDSKTGLMWFKDAGCFENLAWEAIYAAVNSLNSEPQSVNCQGYQNVYDDWVVPNATELWSLIDQSFDYPALNGPLFRGLRSAYWSSTTAMSMPQKAFAVSMDEGSMMAQSKMAALSLLPVRFAQPMVEYPRREAHIAAGVETQEAHILLLSPDLHNKIHWPPAPRFHANDDGTSMDMVTGVYWLTDANCFEKVSWRETLKLISKFNAQPRSFECQGYDGVYDDWVIPTVADYREIVNPAADDNAEWLGTQGIQNVKSTADYWTNDETQINLYYAYVFNFKTIQERNYPKSLAFFLWPRRAMVSAEKREPFLSLTSTGVNEEVSVSTNAVLSLMVQLHSFGLRYPADYWFWYETPDDKRLWMTSIRTWTDKMTPMYQTDLLNLRDYELFRSSDKKALAPGQYTFHFAVDDVQNGILDGTKYETILTVHVEGN
nr:DUF1566 domain-containing protein [Desulfobulbaceae bacterium]